MSNYNTPKEANARGGKNASQKLYRCPVCQTMGRGSKMINQHLAEGCKGPGYRALRNQDQYRGREREAEVNTAVYNAQRMINEEKAATREMVNRIKADIKRMKDMGSYDPSIF
jgi:hypothetical protein